MLFRSRASALPMSGSMKLTAPPETVIVHVVSLKADTAAVEEGADKTAEPEVLKKGKKEDAAAPAAAGDAKKTAAPTKAAAPAKKK